MNLPAWFQKRDGLNEQRRIVELALEATKAPNANELDQAGPYHLMSFRSFGQRRTEAVGRALFLMGHIGWKFNGKDAVERWTPMKQD